MTAIGELRHRVKFQSLTLTVDELGGHTEAWTDFVTLWASIEPTSGSERFFAQRLEDIYTHKIRLRAREDLTSTMRVLFGDRIFHVKEIRRDLERKDFMTAMCVEGVGT